MQPEQTWQQIGAWKGIILFVLLEGEQVKRLRACYTPAANDPEESMDFHWWLTEWNNQPDRILSYDVDAWENAEGLTDAERESNDLFYEVDVSTAFTTLLQLYVETDRCLLDGDKAVLIQQVVSKLSDIAYSGWLLINDHHAFITEIFASLPRVHESPFTRAERSIPDPEAMAQPFQITSGRAVLPPYRAAIPLIDIEPLLQDFEACHFETYRREADEPDISEAKGTQLEMLRRVYLAISKAQDRTLEEVNKQRGSLLPDSYVNGEVFNGSQGT